MPTDGNLRIGGIVLCGGESTRMGRPKAWLQIAGEPMLGRIARVLSAATAPVIVVAAPGQALPPLDPAVEVVRDARPGQGPLEGIAAGLRALAGRCEAGFVSACDVPWLRAEFVAAMASWLGNWDAAAPMIDGQPFPLSAVYRTSLLPQVERMLADEERSPRVLLDRVRCRWVPREAFAGADPALRSLSDLTHPEDYERAIRDSGA